MIRFFWFCLGTVLLVVLAQGCSCNDNNHGHMYPEPTKVSPFPNPTSPPN